MRIGKLADDGNLDLEDLRTAFAGAAPTKAEAQQLLDGYQAVLEPAAAKYLKDSIAGGPPTPPNRQLLQKNGPGPAAMWAQRSDVIRLQDALNALGKTVPVNGTFGAPTEKALAEWQKAAGLPETGRLDSRTLLAMNLALVAASKTPLDITPRARVRPDQVIALKYGDNTKVNAKLQAALNALIGAGVFAGVPLTDAKFGIAMETNLRAFQRAALLPDTGIFDVTTRDAMNALLTTKIDDAPPKGGAGFKGAVELHFFPGEHEYKLYVVKNGRVLDSYGMVGGKAKGEKDGRIDNGINFNPTPAGSYQISDIETHASSSWPWSRVPYGAQLRETGGEVEYRDVDGKWYFATGPRGRFRGYKDSLLAADYKINGALPAVYTANDFGHLDARLLNPATGNVQGHQIHNTPPNESTARYFEDTSVMLDPAVALEKLGTSHACEHFHPRDLDTLVAKGYLATGTKFVVHGYGEKSAFKPAD